MSEDGGRRRFDAIDDADRLHRPAVVRRLTFEELAPPGPAFRDTRYLVPIESIRAGDEQVFAARGRRGFGEPIIDLDPLAEYPSVRSVVASTTVRARRPLPQLDELLLFGQTVVPDSETLRCLRASSGSGPGGRRAAGASMWRRCQKGCARWASAATTSPPAARRRRASRS